MTLVIDIDDTILQSEFENGEYKIVKVFQKEIDKINDLFHKGVCIIMYTGRSWGQYAVTKKQLWDIGLKYNELVMGKPVGDYYIDSDSLKSVLEI